MRNEEINNRVAKEVLGWQQVWFDRRYGFDNDWSQDGPYPTADECKHTPVAYWQEPNGSCVYEVDECLFSTDQAAARLVEDEMERRGEQAQDDYMRALIQILSPDWSTAGMIWKVLRATPEQRCLAALKTVEDQ